MLSADYGVNWSSKLKKIEHVFGTQKNYCAQKDSQVEI